MKTRFFFVVTVAGLGASATCFGQDHVDFRLVGYELTPNYAGLRFERSHNDWRTVSFMDGTDGGLAIRTPKAEGILEWNDLTAIRITSVQNGSSSKLAVVEYVSGRDHLPKTFEMGVIDNSRLKELKHRYRRYVKFVSSKSSSDSK